MARRKSDPRSLLKRSSVTAKPRLQRLQTDPTGDTTKPPLVSRPDGVLEAVYEADPDGRPVVHHRTVDTLGIMLRAGTITQGMHDAARDFQAQFTIARFDVVRCMSLIRLPGGGGPGDFTDAQVDARRRIGKALDALGGLGSPAGSCVWHVVGLQRSIREWSMRQGWGGRPIGEKPAQGVLIAALGVLARHYGYARSSENNILRA